MTGECSRCGECCRYLPLLISRLDPPYLNYLRCRGLKEDQGFILIPHDCQHLKSVYPRKIKLGMNAILEVLEEGEPQIYLCDIHDSPDRPAICQKFHGQKRIGNAMIYIPPGCTMRKKEP